MKWGRCCSCLLGSRVRSALSNQPPSPSLAAVTPDPRPPPAVAGSLESPTPHPEATLQALRGRVVGSGQRLAKGMGARHQEGFPAAGQFGPEKVMGEAGA